tara:strand:+ start:172 stop:1383 length:1212 start_codon:yes stop_codon:yes gene_type:complete
LTAFNYTALDKKGKRESGTLSADSLNAARRSLLSKDLSPINIEEINNKSIFSGLTIKKISTKSLIRVTRQLGALLKGGLPLESSLTSIGQESKSNVEKEQLLKISTLLKEGKSFSDSLREFPQSFSRLFISLIQAGESSGNLSSSLESLSNYLERKEKIKNEVLGALVYPLVLSIVALSIISLLLILVVPNIVNQFSTSNQELPFLTIALISISNFISSYYFLSFLIITMSIFLYFRIYHQNSFTKFIDKTLLKIPYFNNLLVQADVSRFLNSMSLLRNGGIGVLDSISISTETIANAYLKEEFSSNLSKVEEGTSFAEALKGIEFIPSLVIQMVASGERGGELEEMLSKTSDYLDQEFQQSSKIMISILEPIIVVIMGGAVATIIIAILLPLIQMNNLSLIN